VVIDSLPLTATWPCRVKPMSISPTSKVMRVSEVFSLVCIAINKDEKNRFTGFSIKQVLDNDRIGQRYFKIP
jgi:hypothetical protein